MVPIIFYAPHCSSVNFLALMYPSQHLGSYCLDLMVSSRCSKSMNGRSIFFNYLRMKISKGLGSEKLTDQGLADPNIRKDVIHFLRN